MSVEEFDVEPPEKGPMVFATEVMLAGASHLNVNHDYDGPKAALMALARKIDAWDAVVEAAVAWSEDKSGRRPRVPLHDGNSLGSYARLCDMLALTPTSRAKLEKLGENLNRGPAANTGKGTDADDDAGEAEGGKRQGALAKITALRAGVSAS